MKKLLCSIIFISAFANAQVGIGISTANIAASAQLDVTSTTKGFLPPRMTGAQKNGIANPAAGLVLWCSNCGPTGELQVFNGTLWTNLIGGTAQASPIFVGDLIRGGIVGYIFKPGDAGYVSGETHGLIITAADIAVHTTWGCVSTAANFSTGSIIGTGWNNTINMINGCPETNSAARVCDALVLNGYSDWYLPSLQELNVIYLNRALLNANFSHSGYYWCSTHCGGNTAYGFGIDNGDNGYGCGTTSDPNNIRAVRNF